jgi:UDPglucose 6-dehydrogenase
MGRKARAAIQPREPGESIAVIGAGYIGLPTAVGLASFGYKVVCADNNKDKVVQLRKGQVNLHEEHLEEMVSSALSHGSLTFVTSAREAALNASIVFICVPTPQSSDGTADVSAVVEVAKEIGASLCRDAIVVTRSTVPVGMSELLSETVDRPDIHFVSNPEFLREGSVVRDFFEPDRVLIGALNENAAKRMMDLYSSLERPIIVTDPRTAELTKYASNAFLATRLTFVNSMARLCDSLGADVHQLMNILGMDPRIGSQFLKAGPGWGGSCLPKDTRALASIARSIGEPFHQLESTIRENDDQFDHVVDRIQEIAGGHLTGKMIAVWGLAFKANTNDLRDSPSLAVIRRVLARGAHVVAHDPAVAATAVEHVGVSYAGTALDACVGASALVVLTDWSEFANVDPIAVASLMARPVVLDTRNVLPAAGWRDAGISIQILGAGSRSGAKSSPKASAA